MKGVHIDVVPQMTFLTTLLRYIFCEIVDNISAKKKQKREQLARTTRMARMWLARRRSTGEAKHAIELQRNPEY